MRFLTTVLLLICGSLLSPLTAQSRLLAPDEFLPHRLGEQFTPHHLLSDYFEYLADQAPGTMQVKRYGTTYEGRPLQIALFSSPENMARLEAIRINNLRLAGVAEGKPETDNPVAIVWLSMSVHGNEPSGAECSMLLAHRLAAQSDPEVQEWLKNTVVIIDPALNPDGYDRYTHWYRMVANKKLTPQPETREHLEPWPGGRGNHYNFDLNRDWAWATQVETRQRLEVYQDWLPHIHADLHEQYPDNPYYFAPAAEPMHDYITPWQREFQGEIGRNHAGYFDRNGWLYFTREIFDLFYPSYGDTYPMFNGSIGMTYEQAGHGVAGRAYLTGMDDTLTLRERIEHHATTSLSTIETGSRHAQAIVENFRRYFTGAMTEPQGQYRSFILPATNDPNRINALCALLDRHRIRYGKAGARSAGLKAFDYVAGVETQYSVEPNDLVISAYQPHSVLVQVLFEPEPRLADSMTYDITAWSLPFAYGLQAYALKSRLDPQKPAPPHKAPEVMLAAKPYAWCLHRNSFAEARFLAGLQEKGLKVRYATHEFALADQVFAPGSLVITRADNMKHDGEMDGWVQDIARRTNVTLHPIFSGYSSRGRDLGSESYQPVRQPKIALVYGDAVDRNAYGHCWHFFEQELEYPVAPVALERLGRLRLDAYNTLVLPDGSYRMDDEQIETLHEWVKNGGRLIALDNAVRLFADRQGYALKTRSAEESESKPEEPTLYRSRERIRLSEQSPGSVVKARLDPTHPLAFGLGEQYFSLKSGSNCYALPEQATTPVWLGGDFQYYGFIGTKLRKRLEKTPVVSVQQIGAGEIIYLVDDPLFRSFWEAGKQLFANALFY